MPCADRQLSRFWVEHLVRQCIIENWATQDEPEHLRTIRNRIMHSDERRTGSMLTVCVSKFYNRGKCTDLVVKRHGRLRINNRIYADFFNIE
ncbi:MAG: hypothetical protein AAFW70_04505 [Cyanobacteria bacterium J06635_10]